MAAVKSVELREVDYRWKTNELEYHSPVWQFQLIPRSAVAKMTSVKWMGETVITYYKIHCFSVLI